MSVIIADVVASAVKEGKPVVALETAVLTSGLPHSIWKETFGDCPECLDASVPINMAVAHAMSEAVQENGALPVWIGVRNGSIYIGLTQLELQSLAEDEEASKVSYANLAQTLQQGGCAGTTVATTLLACKLASPECPIRVLATGGIGGIHQNWTTRLDISADLVALATTPVCVVASGAKSILDLHATVESLETVGVPTLGLGNDCFPPFIEKMSEHDPSVFCVETPQEVADICTMHWNTLGMKSAVLTTVPVPELVAIERGSLTESLSNAEAAWLKTHQTPSSRTPFLLCELATITHGKSLVANIALLCNNAARAAEIAIAIAK